MFPKLYIVESKERDGLVKIGSAGTGEKSTSDDVVYGRVRSYATGISDNSIVHEAYGHKIFESYLHEFVRDSRKEIEVSFLANVYRPEEWFVLSPTNAKILVEAFGKGLPKHIDEVESVDLPMFLLGVLSAANWHAIRTSDSVLAAELAKSQLLHSLQSSDLTSDLPSSTQDPFTSNLPISPQHNLPLIDSLQSPSPISDPSWNSHPVSPQYDSPSVQSPHQEAWTDFVSQSTSAAKRVSSIEQDSRDRDQIEAARSLIALTGALMTFILLVFGASIQAAIMGIIFFVILCAWPYIHPLAAAWLRAFRRETANARSRANELETENRKT